MVPFEEIVPVFVAEEQPTTPVHCRALIDPSIVLKDANFGHVS